MGKVSDYPQAGQSTRRRGMGCAMPPRWEIGTGDAACPRTASPRAVSPNSGPASPRWGRTAKMAASPNLGMCPVLIQKMPPWGVAYQKRGWRPGSRGRGVARRVKEGPSHDLGRGVARRVQGDPAPQPALSPGGGSTSGLLFNALQNLQRACRFCMHRWRLDGLDTLQDLAF